MSPPRLSLADGARLIRIRPDQLWTRYLALGGNGDVKQLRAHINAPHCPDRREHQIIAQSLNELFLERGHDHPVAYEHL